MNCPGRGIQVMKGDHITIEFCETHHNGDMGLVVSEGATNALILNCDSHHNIDVENNGENADGFGAKSNLGEGTIFRGCRACGPTPTTGGTSTTAPARSASRIAGRTRTATIS
jgi:hypothetical protein